MGDVIQFVSKSERERARLIQEARAMYESIFPPGRPGTARPDKARAGLLVSSAGSRCSDAGPLS